MKRWIGLVVGGLLAVSLSACGSSTTSTSGPATTRAGAASLATVAPPDGGITIYSGQHEQTMMALVKAFTDTTGIPAQLRSAGEATLANQVLQEGSDSPADVFVAGNPPALNVLDDKHLLAPTAPSTLTQVASTYRPTSGDWVGVSARSAALAYNTDQVQESALPTSIRDLARPEWKGKVGFAPSETDFQPLITALIKTDGVDAATRWLKALKVNGQVYDSNESISAAVDSGEVQTGMILHYYWYRLRDEVGADKVKVGLHHFAPGDPGSLVDVSGAGQLASSKHPGSAQAFLAFLVSTQAQQIIATSASYEYPLVAGVESDKGLRPLSDFGPPVLTIAEIGDGQQALDLLQQVGLL
jgi:iron(III) transport system substrate-binding protein